MERRRASRAYVKLLSHKKDTRKKHKHKQQKENQPHQQSNKADATANSVDSLDVADSPVSDGFSSLHRSRSMRASLRLLKDKLHQTRQNAFQSPFKLHAHLSLRRKGSDSVTTTTKTATAARLLDELDVVAALTRPVTQPNRQRNASQVDGGASRQSCDQRQHPTASQPNNEGEPDYLSAQLRVPRKACKLLQIPESYCLKYLSEQQQQGSAQIKSTAVVSTTNAPSAKAVKATATTTTANQKSMRWADIAASATMSVADSQEQNFEEKTIQFGGHARLKGKHVLQTSSDGIYGTTRMRTATIRKPVPYLNSRRCPNTLANKLDAHDCPFENGF